MIHRLRRNLDPPVHKFCTELQSGAGQRPESSLQARPGGTASSRTAEDAQVAQLVEQGTENPRVGGSIPSPATIGYVQATEIHEIYQLAHTKIPL